MSLNKSRQQVERFQKIHDLLQKRQTGTSDEFAERIGISRSLLMDHLKELRQSYCAPIIYNRKQRTFYYSSAFEFDISRYLRRFPVRKF